ncbi:MAG: hypothetical protein C0595_09420 [Marinilabiliales bacterium]|nr:MAG: hypothetical protein C0595_09420 [Marinilabiliales bacterium]
MRPKLLLLIAILTLGLSITNVEKANAQFGDFEITSCTDYDAVIALIDTVFLESVPAYAKKDIVFFGDPTSVGYFKNGYFLGFPKGKGIVMSTGHVSDIESGNTCSGQASSPTNGINNDQDLNILAEDPTQDGCIIEFKFKPSADLASFTYVFGSEEYNEFTSPTEYNDAFGFLLSGNGISGGNGFLDDAINIAEIPGTHIPCSIKNINIGDGGSNCGSSPNGCNHCEFFIDNSQPTQDHFNDFVFDGFTEPMPAEGEVEKCQWYTIRLKVGDAVDNAYDTGVFLEKGSFVLGNADADAEYSHPTIDSLIYESCGNNDVDMVFNLTSVLSSDFEISYRIEGSATVDEDYQTQADLEGYLEFPAGVTSDTINFYNFYADPYDEGIEDILVIYKAEICNPFREDTAFIFISDKPYFGDTTRRYETTCEDMVTLSFGDGYLTGIPPYSYSWQPGSFNTETHDFTITGTDSTEVLCIVTDTCGRQVLDTAIIIVPPISVNAGPDKDLCNVTSVQLEGSTVGGQNLLWTSNPVDPSLAGQETLPDPIVSPAGTTEYTLTATDNCTHEETDIAFALLEGASANATTDNNAICIGDDTEITVNAGSIDETYIWTANPADPSLLGQETNQVINVTPTVPTTYTVEVTNACSFTAETTIEIIVNPLPNANAGINNAICFGDSYALEASGGEQYVWTSSPVDPSLVGQEDIYNPNVTPDTQTDYTYTVEVTDINGCVNTDDMVLQVDPVPDITLDPSSDFMCYDDAVSIEAVGNADDLTWTADPPDASLSGQENNAIINVSPLETTTYTLVGNVMGFSCPVTLYQTINVKPELFSTFDIQADKVCENSSFMVNYTGNAGSTANYTWDFDGASINSGTGIGPYDLQWAAEGNKVITLQVEEDGCPAEPYTMNLDVVKSPVSDFASDIISGCNPLTVEFTSNSTNTTTNVSYELDLGNGSNANSETTSTTYTEPGLYDISLVVNNEGLCGDTKTENAYIEVYETPTADFVAVPPESILEDNVATINFADSSNSIDVLTYEWNFGDGSSPSTQGSPSHVYTEAGEYTVTLDIETNNGCLDHTEKTVTVHPDFVVYAPSGFSPNGDGLNDVFEVKGIGLKKFKLQIFSRWGELIFESDNIEDQWDGKYNGEFVPTGTYVYNIKYTSMLDKDKVLEGTVTVLK